MATACTTRTYARPAQARRPLSISQSSTPKDLQVQALLSQKHSIVVACRYSCVAGRCNLCKHV